MRTRIMLFTLLGLTLGSAQVGAQESVTDSLVLLSGTILGSGAALSGASIVVAGAPTSTATEASGNFRLGVLPGRRFLHVRAVGYEPFDSLLVIAGGSMSLVVRMRRIAVQLDSVRVTASITGKPARYSQTARFDAFYERRATAIGGTFLTREDIERKGSTEALDLLRSVPGIEMSARNGMAPLIRFARCTSTKSSPFGSIGKMEPMSGGVETGGPLQLFMDGSRVGDPLSTLAELHAGDIEAIEIYRGVAELPIEARGSGCAAIFVWTRYSVGSVLDKPKP